MSKIYNEDRWDEDDACVECGEPLVRESQVLGLCQDCYANIPTGPQIRNQNKMGSVSIQALPPED